MGILNKDSFSILRDQACVRVRACVFFLCVYKVIFLPQHQYKYRFLISFMFRSLYPPEKAPGVHGRGRYMFPKSGPDLFPKKEKSLSF